MSRRHASPAVGSVGAVSARTLFGRRASSWWAPSKESVPSWDGDVDLVVEPVCEPAVTEADGVRSWSRSRPPLLVPPVGTDVSATGPSVLDGDHGGDDLPPLAAITVS